MQTNHDLLAVDQVIRALFDSKSHVTYTACTSYHISVDKMVSRF